MEFQLKTKNGGFFSDMLCCGHAPYELVERRCKLGIEILKGGVGGRAQGLSVGCYRMVGLEFV